MFKNIIFDWSGVVNDNTYTTYQVVMEIFKGFGAKEISFTEFKEQWIQPYMKFYNKYLPALTIEEEQKAYQNNVMKFEKNKEYPGISKLIRKLFNHNLNLFVLSSDFENTLFYQIKVFNLDGLFKKIICNVHDKTETVQDIICQNNLSHNQTIIIGDSNHEIEAGKICGIKTCAVTWGFSLEETLKSYHPDFVAHNLTELEKIILK